MDEQNEEKVVERTETVEETAVSQPEDRREELRTDTEPQVTETTTTRTESVESD